MQNVFLRLLRAYKRHGFVVRAGLNPFYFGDPDAPFARLFSEHGDALGVGAGLAPQEIQFLELLLAAERPANALVIGNAFGWSTIALAMLLPGAPVVAMEAGLEGDSTDAGSALTHAIAVEEQLRVKVVSALSPRDTASVVARELGGAPLELVLIDGLHVNEQLVRDIEGLLPHASPACIFVVHDVLSWHMLAAFNGVDVGPGRERRILTRCPSGMGVVFPSSITAEAREVLDAFTDPTVDVAAHHVQLGATEDEPGVSLKSRLARGWKHRRLAMAATYAMEGRADLEIEQLALASDERPTDGIAQFHIGTHHADRQRWLEAERHLREAAALCPDWAAPAQQLGRALRERGRHGEARQALERAARLEPTWATPFFELGLVATAEGDAHEAYRQFAKAAELAPGWMAAIVELGRAAYNVGDDAVAVRALRLAVDAGDVSLPVVHMLALSTERQEGAKAAMPIFDLALAVAPRSADVQFDCARMHAIRGDEERALQHFMRAGSLRPSWPGPWVEAFPLACRLGRAAEADRAVTMQAAIGEESADAWFTVASLHAAAGNGESARRATSRAMELQPVPCGAIKTIARALLEVGDAVSSEAVLGDALGRFPEWAGAHFARGCALESLKRLRDARDAYARASALRPAWADASEAFARVSARIPVSAAS
jgi:tetratricopeptide (TPR) repeat protein/predicted O-methyltransferase YrrM